MADISVSLDIPKNRLVVFTGLSVSGKPTHLKAPPCCHSERSEESVPIDALSSANTAAGGKSVAA